MPLCRILSIIKMMKNERQGSSRYQLHPHLWSRRLKIGLLLFVLAILLITGVGLSNIVRERLNNDFAQWARGDAAAREALVTRQEDSCSAAPFILPAEGFYGLYYADPRGPYSSRSRHQGIDIFTDAPPGQTPVYAAYDGYVTRELNWVSSLIMRIPEDPLNPGRQIWLYYTHLADREGNSFIVDKFPAGTQDLFVSQGTLLGYMGDYNGQSPRNIWVHLHFSIIQDNGQGGYSNELEFQNSIDPSPYLGLLVNYRCLPGVADCTTGRYCE
jgi:murein DD-endopeptidase MepM/ murein hydrolase activator NlpD